MRRVSRGLWIAVRGLRLERQRSSMATSRKRRKPQIRHHGTRRAPASTPYRSIASQMTPAYNTAVREGADAELRGDAAEALRLHRSVPFFRRSTHGDQLEVLARLGEDAPSWMVSRWVTLQARRPLWTGGDEQSNNRALQRVVPVIYPEYIPWEPMGCDWPEQVLPFIHGRDWVVRQAELYEFGALRGLVANRASEELLSRADDMDAWVRAPMCGVRLEFSGSPETGPVVVTDLSSRKTVEVLDLGIREQLDPGQHLLARIVPTQAAPGLMFDWRPLPVPERTARAVANWPSLWMQTLHRHVVDEVLELGFSHQSETLLTSDLPQHSWMGLLGTPLESAPDVDPDPVIEEALMVALSIAADEPDALATRRHQISELMLEVALTDEVLGRFAKPWHLSAWQTLAGALTPPARERCEQMVIWSALDLPQDIA